MIAREMMSPSSRNLARARIDRTLKHLASLGLMAGLLAACGGGSESPEPTQAAAEATRAMALATSRKPTAPSNAERVAKVPDTTNAPAPSNSGIGYYVNAVTGNDSHPGTVDLPWRTLARLRNVTLNAGEGLFLRCGQVWRESLILGKTQLADNSIVAGYGPDCHLRKAVITGADQVTGNWQLANGVWSVALPPTTPKITQLFINDRVAHTARWPNQGTTANQTGQIGNSVPSALTSSQGVTLRSMDSTNLAAQDLVGATLLVRSKAWLMESRQLVSQAGTNVRLNRQTDWDLHAGQQFILQDKRWLLDAPGEFFHDIQQQRLYVIPPSGNGFVDLNQAHVEASVRDLAFAASERNGLIIRDLEFRAARLDGIRMTDTPLAQLTRIEAHLNQGAGVRLWQWVPLPALAAGLPGPRVADILVTESGEIGIDARYVDRAQIQRVVVRSTGTSVQHSDNVLAAIAGGPGARIEDSQVDGSGYIGIRFSAAAGSSVLRNTVSNYCKRLSDCGAIYTWTGRGAAVPATQSRVEANRIFGADDLGAGTAVDGSDVIAGVYVDDYSHGVQVVGNTVHGVPTGILVHNASRTSVIGNRIWLPSRVGIWATMDERDVDAMSANLFTENQIIPLVSTKAVFGTLPEFRVAQAFWFWHWISGASALAADRNNFVNNTVLQLQGGLAAHAWLRGPGNERYLNALEWQSLNPAEPAVQRPLTFDALQVSTGPELVQNGNFDAGLSAWRTWHHTSSTQYSAVPVNSRPGCAGPCIALTSGHGTDLLASAPFQMRPGVPHVFRWRAVLPTNSNAGVAYPYISRESSPWDAMWNEQGFVGHNPRQGRAGEVLDYAIFFNPKSEAPGRVNLQLDTLGVSVAMENISVREVTGYNAARVEDWARLAHAPVDSPRTWTCGDLGWPANCQVANETGTPVNLPLTMQPGAMRLLLRTDAGFVVNR